MTTLSDLLDRLRAEYLEMPGLRLQPVQVQRLCGVEPTSCKIVLDTLVAEAFLCVKSDGSYARAADGRHRSTARAILEPATRKAS